VTEHGIGDVKSGDSDRACLSLDEAGELAEEALGKGVRRLRQRHRQPLHASQQALLQDDAPCSRRSKTLAHLQVQTTSCVRSSTDSSRVTAHRACHSTPDDTSYTAYGPLRLASQPPSAAMSTLRRRSTSVWLAQPKSCGCQRWTFQHTAPHVNGYSRLPRVRSNPEAAVFTAAAGM